MNGKRVKRAGVWLAVTIALPAALEAGTAGGGTGAKGATMAQAESPYAEEATQVSAELSKGIDSRSSKVGQEVMAKTVAETRLADGTTLPRGSKLMGHVTEVQPATRDNPNGEIAVLFDHVVARDGHQVAVHALMLGIRMPPRSAQQPMSGMGGPGMGGAGMGGAGMGGGGMNSGNSGGIGRGGTTGGEPDGMNGGMPGGVNGAGPGTAGAPSLAGGIPNGPGAGNMPPSAAPNGGAAPGAAAGAAVGPAGPVGNLPGVSWGNVTVSGSVPAGSVAPPPGAPTAVLFNGQGRNVTLEGGAQMVLAVTPQAVSPQP